MKVVNTNNAEHYHWGENAEAWHLLKTESLSVIEEQVPPGEQEQQHYHERANQFFYVMAGIATIELEGKIFEVPAGSDFYVKAKTLHQLFN